MTNKIRNAKIESVTLRYVNNILTFYLDLKIEGGFCCSLGGYALDEYDKQKDKRIPKAIGLECLGEIMKTVGVSSWEELNGKYLRVVDRGLGASIEEIGNVMEDKWFNIEDFFAKYKERKGLIL